MALEYLSASVIHGEEHAGGSRAPAVRRGALLCCALNLAEILALLLLSVVPSVEDFHLHKLSFGCFLLFSALFIASSYYLQC